jgi:hypothetical protein
MAIEADPSEFVRTSTAPAGQIDKAELDRTLGAIIHAHGDPIETSFWLGGDDPIAWYELNSTQLRPSASAIKTFHLIELFAAYAESLDQPLPGADKVLADDNHPSTAVFARQEDRDDIRRVLSGATVRQIGHVMMTQQTIEGKEVSLAAYNAAANLATAVLGGPDALTRLIRKRDPAFECVAIRRYMMVDDRKSGDNEVTAAALATLYCRLATRKLAGIDATTMTAIHAPLLQKRFGPQSAVYFKDGGLKNDPMTQVRAGWWETPQGPVVYVAMIEQAAPGPAGREATFARMKHTVEELAATLVRAGRAKTE